jgi:hypothetical protein
MEKESTICSIGWLIFLNLNHLTASNKHFLHEKLVIPGINQKENVALTLQAVEPLARKQMQLIEYPVNEKQRLMLFYRI